MPGDEGWFDRFVNWLPKNPLFKRAASWILVRLCGRDGRR